MSVSKRDITLLPFLQGVACIAALVFACLAIRYADAPLIERFGFRQTQTALVSYWMMKEGWSLAYQMPVMGYPWSVPLEFPLYQALVAFLSKLGGFAMDAAGRLTSAAFFLSLGIPAFFISRRLELKRETFWAFCALLWTNPLYMFWGRSFLIEMLEDFLTLMAVNFSLCFLKREASWRDALWCCLFASLGMLQKATTTGPVMLVMAVILFIHYVRENGLRLPNMRLLLQGAVAFGIPLIIGGIWAAYAEQVKQLNPFGADLSAIKMKEWNSGSVESYLDPSTWEMIFLRNIYTIGIFLLLLPLGSKGARKTAAACFALFLLPIVLFLNLHSIHDYYQTACLYFLVGGAAVIIGERLVADKGMGIALLAVVLLLNASVFMKSYYPSISYEERISSALQVADAVKKYTPAGSALVVYGYDWNSTIAYYAERKTLGAAYHRLFSLGRRKDYKFSAYPEAWEHPERFTGGLPIGAIAFCPSTDLNIEDIPKHEMVVKEGWKVFPIAQCYLALPKVSKITAGVPPHEIEAGIKTVPLLPGPNGQRDHLGKEACGNVMIANESIDKGLGTYSKKPAVAERMLRVMGYLNPFKKDASFYLVFSQKGLPLYHVPVTRGSAESGVLPDSVMTMTKRGMIYIRESGFFTTIDVSGLKGRYDMELRMQNGKETLECDKAPVRLQLGKPHDG